MDWLLTVPLLLIEILLVMKLDEATYGKKSKSLGVGSALMIISGYYGELFVTGDLTPRWVCWCLSMCFFCTLSTSCSLVLLPPPQVSPTLSSRGRSGLHRS